MCAVPDVTNLFYADLSREIGRVCRTRGYRLWLADTESNPTVEADLLTSVRERFIDGLIITPQSDTPNRGLYEQLVRERLPLVIVDRELPGFAAPTVTVDHAEITSLAVHHLAAEGHTRIAFLAGSVGAGAIQLRLDGYRRALDELNLPYRSDYVLTDLPSIELGFGANEAVKRILEGEERPTAAFVTTDRRALALISALQAAGVRVPEDFAVVGCDGVELGEIADVPLTTVAQPIRELAEQSVELLLSELEALERRDVGAEFAASGEVPTGTPVRHVLSPRLIRRKSA
jgi:DNA-binding LacI/PurR family transcriptional regulator